MRLNQFIAHAGLCSRRAADLLIQAGHISVNGQPVTHLAYRVAGSDLVAYQGKPLVPKPYTYILLHKPINCVTTRKDPQGRKTVMDYLDKRKYQHLYPVGRLDRNTTGLLLLTNDGQLARVLAHPSSHISKTYQVTLRQPLRAEHLTQLRTGVELADGMAYIDRVELIQPLIVRLTLHSGRNRVIRRVFEQLALDILSLERVGYAGLTQYGIEQPGTSRHLTLAEVEQLKRSMSYE